MRLIELMGQTAVSADRSLQNLWEKGYEQRIFHRILLCITALPVYIQQISGGLEGVERNSQRKKDLHSS